MLSPCISTAAKKALHSGRLENMICACGAGTLLWPCTFASARHPQSCALSPDALQATTGGMACQGHCQSQVKSRARAGMPRQRPHMSLDQESCSEDIHPVPAPEERENKAFCYRPCV